MAAVNVSGLVSDIAAQGVPIALVATGVLLTVGALKAFAWLKAAIGAPTSFQGYGPDAPGMDFAPTQPMYDHGMDGPATYQQDGFVKASYKDDGFSKASYKDDGFSKTTAADDGFNKATHFDN